MQISFAQDRTVAGVVTDDGGLPIPGVNVLVKGTKNGIQTDFDGKFKINANQGQIIVFSFLGMKTQEIVASSTNLKVRMKDDSVQLESVIVNSLGIEVKKNQLASSYSKLKGIAIQSSGETSVLKGLSGKASGVNIVSSSGEAGSSAYIQIRGQNSITGSTQPLFVIDGIPVSNDEIAGGDGTSTADVGQQSRLNDINPSDIESVQILKGVSAAALWGYRAANGVVLIKTKKGKKGKISVDIDSSISFDKANVRFKTQDVYGQGTGGSWVRNNSNSWGDKITSRSGSTDSFVTTGSYFVSNTGKVIYPIASGGKNSTTNFNNSNYDAVINNGTLVDNHISVSGGDENTNFYLGVGNSTQDGIIRNSSYERNSIDFSTSSKIAEKTTFKGKFTYSNINSNRVQQGSNTSGLLLGLYRSPADFDNTDYIGTNYNAAGVAYLNSHRSYRAGIGNSATSKSVGYNNPLWTTDKQLNPNTVNRYLAGIELKHDIKSWLSILGRIGLDTYSDKRLTVFPINSRELVGVGSANESVTDFNSYNVDFMGLGDIKLNSNIDLSYIIGYNISESKYDQRGGSYKNFLIDTDLFSYDNATVSDKTTFLDRTYSKLNGGYFSTAFDYKNFIFLTLGGRLETSSTYSPNTKVYFYPTAEFGYKFTHNLQNNVLTNGKLRATFGQIASVPIEYQGTTYLNGASSINFLGYGPQYDSGAYAGSFQQSNNGGNKKLKPEVKTEIEIGTDLEFFNRLKITATYYSNNTKDLLINKPLAGSSTYTNIYGNFAKIENKGLELEFDLDMLSSKSKIKWNLFGNWSQNKNEVTELIGTSSLFLNGFTGSSSRAVLGEPLGVLWGGKFERNTTGNLVLDANGFPTASDTEEVIGDPNPKWRGGIGTSLEYKNFKLSTLFDASIGGDLWDGTNGALNVFGKSLVTGNEVTLTAPIASYDGTINPAGTTVRGNLHDFGGGTVLLDQSWYSDLGGGFGPVSEQFIKSASWVKWRELTLSYTLDLRNKNIIGFETVTFSGTGRNLWLWTEDKTLGQDPETNLTGGSNGRGLQYFNSPNSKSLIFSVNLKF